jgi:amino acid adenylation domain-containing protein
MSSTGPSAFQLSEKKRALLASLLREAGVEAVTPPRIVRRARTNSDPLSFAQLRLWFLDQLEPGNFFYNTAAAVRLTGQLDVAALERSFAEVIRRHESLRTTFSIVNGEPVQVVTPSPETDLPFIDLSVSPGEDHETEARRLATEEIERPFDLATDTIIRGLLLRLSAREHVAVLTIHHIACDAWSLEILVKEISALYDAFSQGQPSPLAELPIQYIDYARWQREWLRGEVLDKELAYWRDQLQGVATLELPTDRPRPAIQTYVGVNRSFELPTKVGVEVNALGRQTGTTAFMTVLAAFKALLARYTNQTDIVVGTPVANRGQAETEGLIGFFLNTLVLRTDFSGNPTFAELLGRVRETALGAYAHQEIPFEKLVEELQPRRGLSHSPFFQVMFVLENVAQWESGGTQILSGLTMSRFPIGRAAAKFDLTLLIRESPDGWSCFIENNTDLFDTQTIDRLVTHFQTLLEAAVAQPELRLSELPLLSTAERQQLLVEWNATEVTGFEHACIHELFEKQARRTPDACAVFFEGVRLSYAELNARANQIAHHLRRHGVGPESVVGICVGRSADLAVSVLATLKAGGAYLPLDPNYPRERLQFMLKDAAVEVLLTHEGARDVLPSHSAKVICLDSDAEAFAGESTVNPRASVARENPGYVIYTSGSTGRPKGICMPHRALVNLIEWNRASMPAAASTLQFASLNFDVSFQEMFSTWSTGGTLFIVSDELRLDIEGLAHFISEQRIEKVTLPVVVLQQLAERCSARPQILSSLRIAITTGEQLRITPPVVQLFKALRGCRLHNHYGPSETHVVTALVTSDAPDTWPAQPSIGRPIFNTQIYVLDGHLQPVPLGVIGELYIGGDMLARGYLDRPALTAEKFIPDPFHTRAGSRLYRTGDLARYLPNGNIEFLGRIDHQVKIRGFRVEPGEVESVLGQHSSVVETVVLALADAGSEQRLIAYLVCEPGYESSQSEWRRYLAERLPEYMIPAHFVTMKELPLTANGKLDRRALPAPGRSRPELESAYEPPRNAIEEVVVRVWAEVLNVERIGVNDNFFDLCGHSLSATGVVFRLREALRIDLPLRALYESPTPRGLADALARTCGDREVLEEIARTNLELEQLSDDEVKALIEAQDS